MAETTDNHPLVEEIGKLEQLLGEAHSVEQLQETVRTLLDKLFFEGLTGAAKIEHITSARDTVATLIEHEKLKEDTDEIKQIREDLGQAKKHLDRAETLKVQEQFKNFMEGILDENVKNVFREMYEANKDDRDELKKLLTGTPVERMEKQKQEIDEQFQNLVAGSSSEEKPFYQAVDSYTQDKLAERLIFLNAIRALDVDLSDMPNLVEERKKVEKYFKAFKTDPSLANKEVALESLFNRLSRETETVRTILDAQKTQVRNEEVIAWFTDIGQGALEKEADKIAEILKMAPSAMSDEKGKRLLKRAKENVQEFLDEIDYESLKGKTDKKLRKDGDVQRLKDAFESDLREDIATFEVKVGIAPAPGPVPVPAVPAFGPGPAPGAPPPLAPAPAPGGAPGPAPAPVPGGAPAPAPTPGGGTPGPAPAPVPGGGTPPEGTSAGTATETTTAAETSETADTGADIAKPVRDLLAKFLKNKEFSRPKHTKHDPIIQALNSMIVQKGLTDNISHIENFLRNPEREQTEVIKITPEGIQEKVKELNKDVDHDEFRIAGDISDLNNLLNVLKDKVDAIGRMPRKIKALGRKANPAEEVEMNKEGDVKKLIREIEILIGIQNEFTEYESPREILGHVAYYIERYGGITPKKAEDVKIDDIAKKIDKEINAQKDKLDKWYHIRLSFLRPTLKSTLKAIAKDDVLKDLGAEGDEAKKEGKDTETILNKLAKVKKKEQLKDWIKNLPGDPTNLEEKLKHHVYKTVPRLIAYLEIAIRNGKSCYVLKKGRIENLVKLLREVQHDQIKEDVSSEPNLQKRMVKYMQEMNKLTRYGTKVSKQIITKNAKWSIARRLGIPASIAAGGGVAAAVLSLPALASMPALLAAPWLLKSFKKDMPEDKKWSIRRGVIRAAMANGLFLAGATVAWPLGIVGGIAGLTSTEWGKPLGKKFWKHRAKILRGTKKVGGVLNRAVLKTTWWTLFFPAAVVTAVGKVAIGRLKGQKPPLKMPETPQFPVPAPEPPEPVQIPETIPEPAQPTPTPDTTAGTPPAQPAQNPEPPQAGTT